MYVSGLERPELTTLVHETLGGLATYTTLIITIDRRGGDE